MDTYKPLRVVILDKTFPLRVKPEAEDFTRRVAALVDERMRQIRRALPEREDLTVAVMTCLSLAEELLLMQDRQDALNTYLEALAEYLDRALQVDDFMEQPPSSPDITG